jgi:hypothetical protein
MVEEKGKFTEIHGYSYAIGEDIPIALDEVPV